MEPKRKAYLRGELEREFNNQDIPCTEEMLDAAVSFVLENYSVSNISDRDFDSFVDSDAMYFVVERISLNS